MVLLATPTALTISVMALHLSVLALLVTLWVHLVCKMPLFAPTFSVIIVELSGSKIWFPLPFFCAVSGMVFRVQVYTDTENLLLYSLPSALTQGSQQALHLLSCQTCLSGGNPLCWKIYS